MSSTVYPNPVGYQALGQARRPLPPTTKTIPFDYVFQFPLKGVRDNRVQDVVEISMEGVFVALSLGYSLVLDEQRRPGTFKPVIDQRTTPQNPVLVPFFPASGGANNSLDSFLVAGMPDAEVAVLDLTEGASPSILRTARVGADGTIAVDLPVPASQTRRVWDRTNNLLSEVFQVNFPMTPVIGPDPVTRRLPAAGETNVFVYGSPSSEIGVFLLESASTTGDIAPVSGGPFTLQEIDTFGRRTGRAAVTLGRPLAFGDVLLVRTEQGIDPFSMFTVPRPRLSTISLGALAAGLEQIGADLTSGFRLNPSFAALATADSPLDQQAAGLGRAFETGAVAAEEASFRYSIDVVSTGRELQNKEIHNIAGLGIANGDRPFRPFAKPMMFEPRSSIRIQITEISGPPGTLFIVLQGYKILGTGRIPG
jgi:hypothetical protein